MSRIKKVITAAVCAVLCMTLVSCSMVSVNEEKDRAQVAAEVNGTQITKGEVLDQVDMTIVGYGMTSREAFVEQYGADQFASLKESALDQLVENEILYQHAQADGLVDDSEETKAEKRAEIESSLESLRASIESVAENDDSITDKEAYVEEQYNEYINTYGYADLDKATETAIRSDAINAEVGKLNDEVSYTEEDAKGEYDSLMSQQQQLIDEDPTNYTTYKQFGTVVYEPQGSRYIKNLLIGLPEDVQSEIKTLRQNGDDEEADALRDEELAKIKADADAALARAKAGEDFDALIEELGTDTGMTQEPAKTEGYLVFEGSGMVAEFEEAALALPSVGAISELVATDYGYHILQYTSEGGGAIPFEEVKETLMSNGLSTAQSTHLNDTLTQWKEAEDIKTYPERLSTFEG